MTLHPLRPGVNPEQNSTCPEALLISALLEAGTFLPAAYHVSDDDIDAWKSLWLFCCEYQVRASKAPPLNLVKTRFAEFDPIPNVDVGWAASKVLEASAARSLKVKSKAMLTALADDDLAGAFAALENLKRPRGHRKDPADIFDHSMMADSFEVSKIPVPYATLTRATKGGIGPGELWYVAARLATGKSWELAGYAACAAKANYSVGYVSLEMPAKAVVRRILMRLVNTKADPELFTMLSSPEQEQRKLAMDIIASNTPGKVQVLDPSHGRINTTTAIAEMCQEYDLVVVDHVGLMMTSDNRRAIDDWRAMAVISNVLRETTLATGTPIIAAAQINREAERSSSNAPPKVSQLSQSDALGQDADVVIPIRRFSERTMVHETGKVREGPNLRWYSRFDPDKNRFEEITKDRAQEIAMLDEDRKSA